MKIKRKDLNKLIENLILEINPDIAAGIDPVISSGEMQRIQSEINDYKLMLARSLNISEQDLTNVINLDGCYLEFISTNPMSEGKLFWKSSSGDILCQWDAVSGKPKYFDDNPKETMKIKNEGPTPEGVYEVGEIQAADKSLIATAKGVAKLILMKTTYNWNLNTVARRVSWGNFRAPLFPKEETDTFGRTSMYIHGGSIPGSIGCIDLMGGLESFAKLYSIWYENHGPINITVRYN